MTPRNNKSGVRAIIRVRVGVVFHIRVSVGLVFSVRGRVRCSAQTWSGSGYRKSSLET